MNDEGAKRAPSLYDRMQRSCSGEKAFAVRRRYDQPRHILAKKERLSALDRLGGSISEPWPAGKP